MTRDYVTPYEEWGDPYDAHGPGYLSEYIPGYGKSALDMPFNII
jgi:hypothetical protein